MDDAFHVIAGLADMEAEERSPGEAWVSNKKRQSLVYRVSASLMASSFVRLSREG